MKARMQTAAKPRPEQADEKIKLRWRLNLRLKIGMRPHRLVFPKVRGDIEQSAEFRLEPIENFTRLFALCSNITGRRNKNADLFHGKGQALSGIGLCDLPNWVGRITRMKLRKINVLRRQITALDSRTVTTGLH